MRQLTLGVLAASLLAAPAYADKYVYYGDGYYQRHGYGRDYHSRSYYTQPSYSQAAYRTVRCTNSYNPLGTLLGGAAGGIVGRSIGKGKGRDVAMISGAVLGSVIGSGAYRQECNEQVFEQAPVGQPIGWQDYYQSADYTIIPTRDYRLEGRYCREYQAIATVGGRRQDTYGIACMQPDGSWEIIN